MADSNVGCCRRWGGRHPRAVCRFICPICKSKAAGAPVAADISKLQPGDMMTIAWRGVPVFLVNRTAKMLADVETADPMVADPATEHPFSMALPVTVRTNTGPAQIIRTFSSS